VRFFCFDKGVCCMGDPHEHDAFCIYGPGDFCFGEGLNLFNSVREEYQDELATSKCQ